MPTTRIVPSRDIRARHWTSVRTGRSPPAWFGFGPMSAKPKTPDPGSVPQHRIRGEGLGATVHVLNQRLERLLHLNPSLGYFLEAAGAQFVDAIAFANRFQAMGHDEDGLLSREPAERRHDIGLGRFAERRGR